VEALKQKRQQALALADDYLRATFLDLFGDPITNPKGWPMKKLSEVAKINPPKAKLQGDDKVSFIPMKFVDDADGKVTESEERLFSEVKTGYTGFIENDILFAKITPCMENGKAAIAKNLVNNVGFGSTEFHIIRPLNISVDYIFHFIRRDNFRNEARNNFTGSAGQKRVPKNFLENVLVPIPSKPEQDKFEQIVKKFEALKTKMRQSQTEIDHLAKSLSQKAFRGELS